MSHGMETLIAPSPEAVAEWGGCWGAELGGMGWIRTLGATRGETEAGSNG